MSQFHCGRSPSQAGYPSLTRSPLYRGSCDPFLVRLACVRHAASVRSEPGSNSPFKLEAPKGLSLGLSDLVIGLTEAQI